MDFFFIIAGSGSFSRKDVNQEHYIINQWKDANTNELSTSKSSDYFMYLMKPNEVIKAILNGIYYVCSLKKVWEVFSNFVAFSEYLNFRNLKYG